MEINKALELFGFPTIFGLDEKEVRKKYRSLMKKNHPDVGGSEEKAKLIIEANETILQKMEDLQKQKMISNANPGIRTVFIKFDSLINIFNGGSVEVRTDKESMTVNKNNINGFNVIVDIDAKVRTGGIDYHIGRLEPRTHSDNYSVTFKYSVTDLMESVDFEIFAYGKHVKLPVSQPTIRLNLTFEHGIKMAVVLERQLVIDEGNES